MKVRCEKFLAAPLRDGQRLDAMPSSFSFFFQAEDGIRDWSVTGVQTCALPILLHFSVPARQTRSSAHNKLLAIGVQTNFSSRAFCHAAPALWNSHSSAYKSSIGKIGRASCRERV